MWGKMKRCLIITGGRVERSFAGSFLKNQTYDLVIAVDSGMEALLGLGLSPNLVVGDLDSVSKEALKQARDLDGLEWDIHVPEKDETDTELALRKAMENECDRITILGATGGRLDHFLGNVHLLYPCLRQGIYAELVDACNRIYLLDGPKVFEAEQLYGAYVSFLPLTETVTGITLTGFKYPLLDQTIHIGTSLCISNEVLESQAAIQFRQGVLICVESRDDKYKNPF